MFYRVLSRLVLFYLVVSEISSSVNQPTGYQWLEELDNLFREMTFFAGDGGEESTPNNKKKRKNSQDLDLER